MYTYLYVSCTSVHKLNQWVSTKQRKIGIFTAVNERLEVQEHLKFHLPVTMVMHQISRIRSHVPTSQYIVSTVKNYPHVSLNTPKCKVLLTKIR